MAKNRKYPKLLKKNWISEKRIGRIVTLFLSWAGATWQFIIAVDTTFYTSLFLLDSTFKDERIKYKAYSSVPQRMRQTDKKFIGCSKTKSPSPRKESAELSPYVFHEQVREVQIIDKRGGNRSIGVRYCASYPVENNDWGEFQVRLFFN